MNKPLTLLCLLLLGFIGWRERENVERWKDDWTVTLRKFLSPHAAAEKETEQVETAAVAPANTDNADHPPSPPSVVPPVEPPPPSLPPPPEGIYYLRERVSIAGDSGVRAYDALTQVTFVEDVSGAARVSDGKVSFQVPYGKLTRDLAEVETLRRIKDESTLLAKATPPTGPQVAGKAPAKTDAARQKEARAAQRRTLQAQIESTNRQIHQFQAAIGDANSKQLNSQGQGKISAATTNVGGYQAEIQRLERQRAGLSAQLAGIPY